MTHEADRCQGQGIEQPTAGSDCDDGRRNGWVAWSADEDVACGMWGDGARFADATPTPTPTSSRFGVLRGPCHCVVLARN